MTQSSWIAVTSLIEPCVTCGGRKREFRTSDANTLRALCGLQNVRTDVPWFYTMISIAFERESKKLSSYFALVGTRVWCVLIVLNSKTIHSPLGKTILSGTRRTIYTIHTVFFSFVSFLKVLKKCFGTYTKKYFK